MFVQGSTAADVCPHQSLDRLAALERIIPSELIDQVLTDTDKHSRYQVKLTNQVMIKVVLGIGLYTDRPIRQVFRCCQRSSGAKTPTRSSLCRARQRLGSEPIRELHRRVVRPLATEATPGAFYRGMRLVAIDGTVLDVPDCDALQDFGMGLDPSRLVIARRLRLLQLQTLEKAAPKAQLAGSHPEVDGVSADPTIL